MEAEAYLLQILDDSIYKNSEIIFLYMTSAGGILYAKYWKVSEIPCVEE